MSLPRRERVIAFFGFIVTTLMFIALCIMYIVFLSSILRGPL